MFRNSLNQGSSVPVVDTVVSKSADPGLMDEEAADEYFEFDGAKLEIKHNATIRQSTVSIGPKISDSQLQPSILEGSDTLHSPNAGGTSSITNMAENNRSTAPPAQMSPNTTSTEVIPQSAVKPKVGSPRHFFCFRRGLFDQAVADCTRVLLQPNNDLQVVGSWLLTIISHWDHERERMVILTKKNLWIIKYDFIAMRIIEKERHELNKFDTIQKGPLTYPPSSIVPERNEEGIQVKWNKGQPLSAMSSWNPFAEIPWRTITNHPLGTYVDIYNSEKTIQENLDQNKDIYLVENLYNGLVSIIREPNPQIENGDVNYDCKIEDAPIVLENYLNVPAMVHNKNNFGFFKVRGKFSF